MSDAKFDVTVNVSRRFIHFRDFEIAEVHGGGWEWAHDDYHRGVPVSGTCQTMFEAIEAVAAWYDERAAA